MEIMLATVPEARDRRVRRSRAALMRAAITLVTTRGTAAVPLSDIAESADVSRQVVYQQFGDRDALLLEAALDLARRELLPRLMGGPPPAAAGRSRALAMAQHFAEHRAFYRAMMTGSSGFALNKALTGLMIPFNRQVVHEVLGEGLDPGVAEDLASYLTGGWGAFINTWVVEGTDPLDPEGFTDRLMQLMSVLTTAMRPPTTLGTPDSEDRR
jgi:AcrR family transcriptional regulator